MKSALADGVERRRPPLDDLGEELLATEQLDREEEHPGPQRAHGAEQHAGHDPPEARELASRRASVQSLAHGRHHEDRDAQAGTSHAS